MSDHNLIFLDNLSTTDFTVSGDGTVGVVGGASATLAPEYEYYNYWAEDSGNTVANGYIYSWGNGDAGIIGMPVGNGVEIIAMAFQADNGGTGDRVEIRMVDIQVATSPVILATILVNEEAQGQNNNTHYYEDMRDNIVKVPDGAVLSFQTGAESGLYNGTRCGVWTRQETDRKILIQT